MTLSVAAFALAVVMVIWAAQRSAGVFECTALGVEMSKDSLTVSADLPLMTASGRLTVTMECFPAGNTQSPVQSEVKGTTLFRSVTGPDAVATGRIKSAVPVPKGYGIVEVRAYRGEVDPGCLRVTNTEIPAACVQIYLPVPATDSPTSGATS